MCEFYKTGFKFNYEPELQNYKKPQEHYIYWTK